ncbi:DUF6261 family protein [uncultured Bacteroides sp.]|uniref:DUF6261 family protein n=1 Tax=uncultured Bacteroides sp. TaxID=162156 RepID=UPI0026202CEC|nr:DUF6261 family protein [uncultured Bacteroides sp.]
MKEIVYNFSRNNARNAQHAQFITDVLNAVSQEVAKAQGFAARQAAFAAAAANELECFRPDKAYLDTPELVAADQARDQLFLFYKHVIQAYADYQPDAARQKAGATLAFAFREAGDVARMDYASETSTLTDLLQKLRQEPYVSALTTIDLSDAPDALEAANTAFNTIYLKRSAVERDRVQSWSMKTLRPVTDDAFDAMAKAINALYTVNEMVTNDEAVRTALGKVIDDVNAIVIRLKKTIGQGTSAVGTGSEGTGGTDAPVPGPDGGGDDHPDGESPL